MNKIESNNLIILNGDAIFNFNIRKIFNEHERKKKDATFLSAESKYQFGTVFMKNDKLIDFKRNIVFESVNLRNNSTIKAFNYAGIIIINKKVLLKYSSKFNECENFEKYFYPILIKKRNRNEKNLWSISLD